MNDSMPEAIAVRSCRCASDYCAHHQALRAALEPRVQAGQAECWRCGRPVGPDDPWDLGHDDHDRRLYRGIEHQRCNRATAGRRQKGRRWVL